MQKTQIIKGGVMLSVNKSFTTAELLLVTSQADPYTFLERDDVTFSDIFLSISEISNIQKIIQELGIILQKDRACLSFIPTEKIHVKKVAPLNFLVLESFEMRSANRTNWLTPPFNRFGFRNITTIHDVDLISKGGGAIRPLLAKPHQQELEMIMYQSHDKTERTFLDMLVKTHTDSIVILHEGSIIYEKYFNGQEADTPHIQFSITKSLLSLIVNKLIHDGVINPEMHVSEYIPELKDSAFGDARVIEVLDMTTATKFNEEYGNLDSDITKHWIAASYLTQPTDYNHPKTMRTFLTGIQKEGEHNQVLHYVSANSEVLSWVVEKATQFNGCKKTVNEFFVELIWSKIGAEHNACIIKDSAGDSSWAAGFTATTRDMARVGEMILNKGRVGDEQLISSKVFEDMCKRDLRVQFIACNLELTFPSLQGWSYTNQFWCTNNEHGAFTAIGIHGQLLYIDPRANLVVAKNSSHPEALDQWLDHDAFFGIHALAQKLL